MVLRTSEEVKMAQAMLSNIVIVNNNIVSISDVGLGIAYGAPIVYLGHPNGRDRYTQRASLSYVTGSHNMKFGFQTDEANTNTYEQANQNVAYYFFNNNPFLILQWATPYLLQARVKADIFFSSCGPSRTWRLSDIPTRASRH